MINWQEHQKLVGFVQGKLQADYSLVDPDELQQIGLLALWKASSYFDPTRGFKWSTYACRAIYNDMLRFIRRERAHRNNNRQQSLFPIPYHHKDNLSNEELVDILRDTISRSDYELLVKKIVDEKSFFEISRIVGVSKQTAINHFNKAMTNSKQLMEIHQ